MKDENTRTMVGITHMTDNDKVNTIVNSLKNNAFKDIERALAGDSKMGAFILCSCLIDAIAGFIEGGDAQRTGYEKFVDKYLKSYDKKKLYKDLRCNLVHGYSEGGSYWFCSGKSDIHLKPQADGKITINLENFMTEINQTLNEYSTQLQDTKYADLRAKAIKRFNESGIISVFNIDNSVDSLSVDSLSGANCLQSSLSGKK